MSGARSTGLAERGWLRIQLLRLDDAPIAASLALHAHGAHYDMKLGYDRAWQRFSPGTVLLDDMVHAAFETGLQRFEILGDENPYKRTWSSNLRERVAFHVPIGVVS